MTEPRPIRIGLVGYGVGGQYFHAPFIEATPGVELAGVVTRNPGRREALARDVPRAPAYDSLAELAAVEGTRGGLDAVTITTPPETRHDLVLEALSLGLHVVADKPFAPNARVATELGEAADAAGLTLGVYHNRRWDSDIVTLRQLLRQDRLGHVEHFHSRMDQAFAGTLEGGPSGGLLRDLGSHLVDQALWLFGPVDQVYAILNTADTSLGPTDTAFHLTLRHHDSVTSHLSASKLNHLDERELRVYGSSGAYVVRSVDVQAQDSFRGRRPIEDPEAWGREPESAWGMLSLATGKEVVPAQQGSYTTYYELFAQAVRAGTPPPVTAADAVRVLGVLDAARASAVEGTIVTVSGSQEES
jgi:predicted dehydrogenase